MTKVVGGGAAAATAAAPAAAAVAPAPQGGYTGPIFPGSRPHAALTEAALPIRVRHSEHGVGNLVGFKYNDVLTGETGGGLSSDGFVRIRFDSGEHTAGWNVSAAEVCFEAGTAPPMGEWSPTATRHRLRNYVGHSELCPDCTM